MGAVKAIPYQYQLNAADLPRPEAKDGRNELFWYFFLRAEADSDTEKSMVHNVTGPGLGLFARLAIVYLVRSSPGVVAAWLGFENESGTSLGIAAVGGGALLRPRGKGRVSRPGLVVWNQLFALARVGGGGHAGEHEAEYRQTGAVAMGCPAAGQNATDPERRCRRAAQKFNYNCSAARSALVVSA